jgi:hypothetical protein
VGFAGAPKGVSAVTYEPIIRYAPIIVPIILAASLIAVAVYRPPQLSSAAGLVLHEAVDPAG